MKRLFDVGFGIIGTIQVLASSSVEAEKIVESMDLEHIIKVACRREFEICNSEEVND